MQLNLSRSWFFLMSGRSKFTHQNTFISMLGVTFNNICCMNHVQCEILVRKHTSYIIFKCSILSSGTLGNGKYRQADSGYICSFSSRQQNWKLYSEVFSFVKKTDEHILWPALSSSLKRNFISLKSLLNNREAGTFRISI